MMRPAIVVGVLVGLAALVCFALGLDDVVIGLIAAGGLGGAAALRHRRKKTEAGLEDATAERDQHVEAIRGAMVRADELATKQADLDDQAADVHRAAADAIKRARELDAE